jgi:hypothetical protein
MSIIDQSSNGTYVNGIRISQNVPVPVTRKDTISFAHVAKLDWDLIPKSNQWVKYLIGGLIALLLIICIVFCLKSTTTTDGQQPNDNETVAADSISKAQAEIRQDSLKKAEQDSIAKAARQDSIHKANKHKQEAEQSKKQKKQADSKDSEQKKQEEQPENKKPTRVAG